MIARKQVLILLSIVLFAFFLRFYKLSSNPPSLYWEEVALGYDAFSLLKTGRDHRGNPWPIVYLNSYMDYKPPLYAYVTIPSVWLFGLNEFGVRFPSAFFGTLTVLVIYFLTKELFKDKEKFSIPIIAALLLAISPWHLQFSRAAFEANLALFLTTSAIWLFLISFRKKILMTVSAFLLALSLYAYHGSRIFAPLVSLSLIILFYRKIWQMRLVFIISLTLGLILSFPLIISLRTKEVHQRFQETSAFATLEPIIESNQKIQEDNGGIIAKIIHHRFLEYGKIFLVNYFNHFNGSYLFLSGDTNPRHSTQEFGIFYHWELITLLLGLVFIFKNPKKENLLIIIWLLTALIPAAMTKATPHALRTLSALPAYSIISAIGLVQLIKLLKNKKLLLFTIYCLLFAELISYIHFYHYHYPKIYSSYWQFGYREAINFVKEQQKQYDAVYLTNNYGRAYMYYLFYTQMNPLFAQQLVAPFKNLPDIPQLDNVFIGKNPSLKGIILGISAPTEGIDGQILKEINFLDGQKAFIIWETE